eukprot:756308-Hanusia_phi.AAC.3
MQQARGTCRTSRGILSEDPHTMITPPACQARSEEQEEEVNCTSSTGHRREASSLILSCT